MEDRKIEAAGEEFVVFEDGEVAGVEEVEGGEEEQENSTDAIPKSGRKPEGDSCVGRAIGEQDISCAESAGEKLILSPPFFGEEVGKKKTEGKRMLKPEQQIYRLGRYQANANKRNRRKNETCDSILEVELGKGRGTVKCDSKKANAGNYRGDAEGFEG